MRNWHKEFDDKFEVVNGRVCFDDALMLKAYIEGLLIEQENNLYSKYGMMETNTQKGG